MQLAGPCKRSPITYVTPLQFSNSRVHQWLLTFHIEVWTDSSVSSKCEGSLRSLSAASNCLLPRYCWGTTFSTMTSMCMALTMNITVRALHWAPLPLTRCPILAAAFFCHHWLTNNSFMLLANFVFSSLPRYLLNCYFHQPSQLNNSLIKIKPKN